MTDNQEEIQEKYAEFQQLTQQIEPMQEQLQVVSQQLEELTALSEQLTDLGSVKKDSNMWASVGGGIFVPSTSSEDYKEVLMNVGASTYVKKPISEAKSLIEGQMNELQEVLEKRQELFMMLQHKILELRSFFEKQG